MNRILGINDDEDNCCCCGKTGLKRVVWIEHEDGRIEHYGTTCATYMLRGNRTKQEVKSVVTIAENTERRVNAITKLAALHTRDTKAESVRFCRERNKRRTDGNWSLYSGDVATVNSADGFYSVPAQCEEKIDDLKRNGWEVS